MPPKVKITKQEIVAATLSLLREQGEQAMNARTIAAAIGCSTQPIFSNFDSLDDLQQSVFSAAYSHYHSFLTHEMESGQYPPYKAFGMAYIRFAKEEKQLFRVLFMCDRKGQDQLGIQREVGRGHYGADAVHKAPHLQVPELSLCAADTVGLHDHIHRL